MNNSFPRRGDVYWVHLDPSVGSETQKTRPCLIISCDAGNANSPLVMIAPITSNASKVYPFEALLEINHKKCKVMLNQARAIDKSRLGKKMSAANVDEMAQVDKAIVVVFGI